MLLCAEAGTIIFWAVSVKSAEISIVAASLASVSALCIVGMLYAEHVYSLQTSTLVSIYLSITLLFSIARTRSYFIREGFEAVGGLSASIVALKLIILILEEVPKRRLVNNAAIRQAGRETFSGFWNRAMLIWLNSTFVRGYRAILNINDLQALPLDLTSEELHRRFAEKWYARKYGYMFLSYNRY